MPLQTPRNFQGFHGVLWDAKLSLAGVFFDEFPLYLTHARRNFGKLVPLRLMYAVAAEDRNFGLFRLSSILLQTGATEWRDYWFPLTVQLRVSNRSVLENFAYLSSLYLSPHLLISNSHGMFVCCSDVLYLIRFVAKKFNLLTVSNLSDIVKQSVGGNNLTFRVTAYHSLVLPRIKTPIFIFKCGPSSIETCLLFEEFALKSCPMD